MNKAELVAAMAERAELSKKDAEAALKAFTDVVAEELKKGEKIQLVGFGTFEVRKKNERVSVHPKTQQRTLIPPKLTLNFKCSNTMKDKFMKEDEL